MRVLVLEKQTEDQYKAIYIYQLLIKKRESKDLKYLNEPKTFIECPNDMDDIYRNTK